MRPIRVAVKAYGYGARLIDCGREGTVVQTLRKRYRVELDPGNGMPAESRDIDPACLRFL